jgi:hypothetical protein
MKFNQMYPKDRFYAADFKGKPVTLTFKEVKRELLGKGGPSEKMMPVWYFEETPKFLPAVLTNGVCARAMFGDDTDDWIGHKITLIPAKDTSGMSDDGLCIRVSGSPELTKPLKFKTQIGRAKQAFLLTPTVIEPPAADAAEVVDAETGEVSEPSDDKEELV